MIENINGYVNGEIKKYTKLNGRSQENKVGLTEEYHKENVV